MPHEIIRLRWSEVDRDRLVLDGSKTGLRIVPLNSQARRILERRPRGASRFVFPSPTDPSRPRSRNLSFWPRARREAQIENVRLHDPRRYCRVRLIRDHPGCEPLNGGYLVHEIDVIRRPTKP